MSAHYHQIPLPEFIRAAERAGLRAGTRGRNGATLVLVQGMGPREAAPRVGCTRQAVEQATERVLRYLRACPLCRRPFAD